MKIGKVRLGPNRVHTGKCGAHVDVRTVHKVEGVFVIDGGNPDRLSINDGGADGNQDNAGEPEVAQSLAWPVSRLDTLLRLLP